MATAPSRGRLVTDFLTQGDRPSAYFAGIAPQAHAYNGFSMLAADRRSLAFFSNRESVVRLIEPGLHGLSNELLDTPWPKVEKGKERLGALLDRPFDPEAYLQLLGDTEPAHDPHLPDTGVGIEWERKLSSIRIADGDYGTRCSTVARIGADGKAEFGSAEGRGDAIGTLHFSFRCPGKARSVDPAPGTPRRERASVQVMR
jgi:uncharacterized protein with NRDE domain